MGSWRRACTWATGAGRKSGPVTQAPSVAVVSEPGKERLPEFAMDGYAVSLLRGQTPSPALFKAQPGDASRAVVALGDKHCIAVVIAKCDTGGGLRRVGDQAAGSGGQGDFSCAQASYGFTVEDEFAVYQKSTLNGENLFLEIFDRKKFQ